MPFRAPLSAMATTTIEAGYPFPERPKPVSKSCKPCAGFKGVSDTIR